MPAAALKFCGLDDLRCVVQQRICEQHELDTANFQMTERAIVRRGQICGIHFCVHGPRSVKLIAIWETDPNSILFYNSAGERIGRTRVALIFSEGYKP